MRKIFNQKNFNNFVGTPLDSRVNTYIFAFRFTLRYLQPDINPIVCHRCQRHRGQICRQCRWYQWQFATGVVDTAGKFAAGIVDTGGKFATGINNTSETGGKICRRRRWYWWQICRRSCWYRPQFCRRCRWHRWQICHRCRWYRWSTLSCEYLREFSKKFETALMVYSGAWGKLIHEKNQKQKISWHCPFKQ